MQPTVDNANIPAFLGKLWKMVNDPSTDHLICWSQGGYSFVIQNQAQFWYELLPLYYKHNNMSSFVRQLNMYGFHKISTVENGTMDADKDEIQFYHPYFQKAQPDMLKNIKRKQGTSTKSNDGQTVIRQDDLSKVLSDVKQLRGRQSSVDSQLTAMKQENAVLWRELALLRQKHIKQQQIVNKLIQFLVTLVQPTASTRMGVGVKRRMPLMLHESPTKKIKPSRKSNRQSNESGPTIHELEEVAISPEELLGEVDEVPVINSPVTPNASTASDAISQSSNSPTAAQNVASNSNTSQQSLSTFWDKPEFVSIGDPNDALSEGEDELIDTLQQETQSASTEKVFLNPNNRDTLIGSLINSGAYNLSALNGKKQSGGKDAATSPAPAQQGMQVATKNSQVKINTGTLCTNDSRDDLDLHLDSTQIELDQLKDILNTCNTFDANALLGLFSEHDPDCGIRGTLQNKPILSDDSSDPLVSGTELASANNLIDFNELFDDELTNQDDSFAADALGTDPEDSLSVETPLVIKHEPLFPSNT